jgi:photosystem II stability/assembly factor-like uncharacterized protein
VYKSTDGGGTWRAINAGIDADSVFNAPVIGAYCLAINPSTPTTLYVGTNSGIYKSMDSGGTWIAADAGLSAIDVSGLKYSGANSLALDPRTPATLYAGRKRGVVKSLDGGESWSQAGVDLNNKYVMALAIDPVTPTTLYAGTNNGIFKSVDGGASWVQKRNGFGKPYIEIYALAIDPLTPATIYAGTSDGVYQSMDAGESWHAINTGLTSFDVYALAIDPAAPAILYAGVEGGGVFSTRP